MREESAGDCALFDLCGMLDWRWSKSDWSRGFVRRGRGHPGVIGKVFNPWVRANWAAALFWNGSEVPPRIAGVAGVARGLVASSAFSRSFYRFFLPGRKNSQNFLQARHTITYNFKVK